MGTATKPQTQLVKGLGLMDGTTIVIGSMIGSGIFIVAADISRQVHSPGLMILTWIVTAILTMIAALSYGELAAAMPKAGDFPTGHVITCQQRGQNKIHHIRFGRPETTRRRDYSRGPVKAFITIQPELSRGTVRFRQSGFRKRSVMLIWPKCANEPI